MIQQINYLKRRIRLAMNKEERLQLENELLMTCSKAQAINKYIDELEESSKLSELWCKSQEENKQLKDNWNKLKEWINKHYDYYMNNEDYIGGRLCFTDMKDKMQEIEQGSDSNE